MRAKADDRDHEEGRSQQIIVTEIPYQVNKARLIERIAELVREKTIEGISDLRDESDRDGMRIVIELKRGEVPEVMLNNLYKHTQLQPTFGIIMLAIVDGRPKVLQPARARSSTSSSSGAKWSAGAPSTSCARPRRAPTSSKA